jgi:hypothetical protein
MRFLPVRDFGLAPFAAVRDDQAGTAVPAVRDHDDVPDGVLRPDNAHAL